jgi:low temperature requirement protein LtrA
LPRYSSHRLPERFGLFIIIVLGENVASVVLGVGEAALAPVSLVAGGLGMALTFASWWLYFDIVQQRPARSGGLGGFMRSYLHLPLILAMIATAAGILTVVAHEHFGAGERWLLAGSVAATFACLALLESILVSRSPDPAVERRMRLMTWLAAAGALAVGVLGAEWGAVGLLAALFTLHVGLIAYGATMWARGRLA